MPRFLTRQQIEQFHEEGFLAPITVMSESEALAYRKRLEDAERRYPEAVNAESRNNAHLVLTCIDDIAHHPRILDVAEDLVGPDLELWGTVLFIKEPQSAGFVSWHQDATYMGIEPREFVSPWLALTPSNRTNGCMSMIPGSHKGAIRDHIDTFDSDNILTRGQEIRDVDESLAIDLILQPGQMSVHHARIVHGSRPNRSGNRRIGVVMQGYMASGSRQVIGENQWMPVRGECRARDHEHLKRPQSDMEPEAVEHRRRVNENWTSILYHNASTRRAY